MIPLNDQIVVLAVMILQLLWPVLVPKIGAERLRKLVPLGNSIISLVTQLWAGFTQAIPPPDAANTTVVAGFFGTFGPTFLDVLVNSLIQTFVVTGAHSAVKNTKQGLNKPS